MTLKVLHRVSLFYLPIDLSNQFFLTDFEKKNPDGFIHSTGHGLGLEIHEPPRVSSLKEILKANQVITIEPGLYYSNIGGVRIEDTVVVTKEGCKSLSKFPKFFEI